ncbi:MAG TPA: PQQ-dependent dehydrogenase, methanol/ethanol family [Bryobacteraceae bacterium]|nr:PQQ-dependent dehydrogenase, methanol/ethanol family [Bryobacteraceae bacterium]
MRTLLFGLLSLSTVQPQTRNAAPRAEDLIEAGRKEFEARCAPCHGGDGRGGERAPAITGRESERVHSEQDLRRVIRMGIPEAGMPPFRLPQDKMDQLAAFVRSLTTPAIERVVPGDVRLGREYFFGTGGCAKCHTAEGRGGVTGPDLSNLGRERTLAQIERALRTPAASGAPGYKVATVHLRDGQTIRGLIKNESSYDVQLMDLDGRLHLLNAGQIASIVREEKSVMPAVQANGDEIRNLLAYLSRLSESSLKGDRQAKMLPYSQESFAEGDWPTYHGHPSGNRHSPLRQITTENVARLAPKWIFTIRGSERLEVTPVVVDGVMYVTGVNQAYALDARTGRLIWSYRRRRTEGVIGDAAGGINRGVALLGDRVFLVTDNAHLLALNRFNGALIWDVEMADYRQHYGATSAPLIVRDMVVSGTSGGDEGVRGFVAAYSAATGERLWRFWTIPLPGEPLSETWVGRALEHGCASAWLTGTYDPATDLLYWPTGNPCPDFNGDERKGDNLYSDSVLALRPDTGALKWFYQFTPHDLHDWDSQQTPMLVDTVFRGRPRQLLLQANRNGFFYVLDRVTGEFLLAKPFVKKLTWASGIGPDGRPQLLPGSEPTIGGVRVCPSMDGATNWMSTAFNPSTGLFYLMALEKCNIFAKSAAWWEPGKSFYGGASRAVEGEVPKKYLRAINVETGEIVWEYPQIGPGNTWGGVLSTAGGLVFFGDDSGAFAAVDAKDGKPLWNFHTSQVWKASPMTYMAEGRQYVAVAAGSNIIAFGLP